MTTKANDIQIGGDHYKGGGPQEHWDVIARLYGPGYFIAAATKYVQRWRKKNGRQDLEKAAHYLQKLIELIHAGVVDPLQLAPMEDADAKAFMEANQVQEQDAWILTTIFTALSATGLTQARLGIERLLTNLPAEE